jgi:hypothetical protein
MEAHEPDLKRPSYEGFILLLSLLSLGNLAFILVLPSGEIAAIIQTVDFALAVVLLVDFGYRLVSARDRSDYLLRGFGWLDFLGSLPIPLFRIGRIYRVVWVSRKLGLERRRGVFRRMVRERAEAALLGVLFLTIVLLEVASALMLSIELGAPNSNIRTASDALWWTWVSVTTVGYGDRYPVTDAGRWIGVITLAVGVGLFGTFTGWLANAFLKPNARFEAEGRAREQRFANELALIRQQLGIPDHNAEAGAGSNRNRAETPSDTEQPADPVSR